MFYVLGMCMRACGVSGTCSACKYSVVKRTTQGVIVLQSNVKGWKLNVVNTACGQRCERCSCKWMGTSACFYKYLQDVFRNKQEQNTQRWIVWLGGLWRCWHVEAKRTCLKHPPRQLSFIHILSIMITACIHLHSSSTHGVVGCPGRAHGKKRLMICRSHGAPRGT
jgi:hypothetical protein